jgi:hypothetical protein
MLSEKEPTMLIKYYRVGRQERCVSQRIDKYRGRIPYLAAEYQREWRLYDSLQSAVSGIQYSVSSIQYSVSSKQ